MKELLRNGEAVTRKDGTVRMVPDWYSEENAAARAEERHAAMTAFLAAYATAAVAASKSVDANVVKPNIDIVVLVHNVKRANDLLKSGLAVAQGKSACITVQSASAPKCGAATLAKELAKALTLAGWQAEASAKASL